MRTLLFLVIMTALVARRHPAARQPACVPCTTTVAAAEPPADEAPVAATAEAMQSDYRANEISADERYKDRPLDITGTVQAIRQNVLDTPYLIFQVPDDPRGVQAIFNPAFKKALAHVAKGDTVLARCRGDGAMNGIAALDGCILLEDHHPEILVDPITAWP